MSSRAERGTLDARARIIDGGIQSVVRLGAAGASMSAIASAAGVSKALLHYHFADRAALLVQVIELITERLVQREQTAFAHLGAREGTAVDALWLLVKGELDRGELRAVLELGTLPEPAVAEASHRARQRREHAAVRTIGQVLTLLDLVPRVPVELIAGASVAFVDGLAIGGGRSQDTRPSFDVFWLAILSLCD